MGHDMPSRRLLLKASLLAGGGLMLGLRLPSLAGAADHAPAGSFTPNAFLSIDPKGTITFIMPHTEVGQGITTSSAMLMGEELEVGLDQIQVQAAPPDMAKYMDPLLFDQATGGSASTRADWQRLRTAAATARVMLITAAAQRWGVDAANCRAERGVVHHDASNRSVGYGEVASDAATLPVPHDVKLKDPTQFALIGTNAKRLDTPAKVNGSAVFGIDAKVPGMKVGTLAITPVKGGALTSMNEAAARRVPGVLDVVQAGDQAVAVIGVHMWAAKQGLDALEVVWNSGPNGRTTTASMVTAMDQASQTQGVVAKQNGDAAGMINGAATKLSAVYQLPFLSHSPMEPLNCTVHVQPGSAEIWVGTQVPVRAQKAVADATGVPQDKVTVNNLYMGGAFGRRLDVDSIAVAAAIAK